MNMLKIEMWRKLNNIRKLLNLAETPMPEILKLDTREIILNVLKKNRSENLRVSKLENTKSMCEVCGAVTDELYKLKRHPFNNTLSLHLEDRSACFSCYINEIIKAFEKYGLCPKCSSKVRCEVFPTFRCENGHQMPAILVKVVKPNDEIRRCKKKESKQRKTWNKMNYKYLHDKAIILANYLKSPFYYLIGGFIWDNTC